MGDYEALQKMFKESEYNPTKFVCKDCEETLFWGDSQCKKCKRLIVWESVIKNPTSFIVKI